jgi:hypothetical protein
LIFAVDENTAIKDFIHSLLNSADFKKWLAVFTIRNPEFTDDKIIYLYLKRKFGSSPIKFARLWNKFRFNNARLLTMSLNNKLTSIYTVDNAKARLKTISDDLDIFLNEDRFGSFTQYVEALMEEGPLRRTLNSDSYNLNLSEEVYTIHIGKHNSKKHDNIATLPDIGIYSLNGKETEFVLAKRYRGLFGIDSKGNFAEDFLIDMGKSFQDPTYNARHYNCGIFAYKDIMDKPGVIETLPSGMIREVRSARAGVCLIGVWRRGPPWMSRFGELFNATKIELFMTKTQGKPIKWESKVDKILERFARGRKILKGVRRKELSREELKFLFKIIEKPDTDEITIHYWITEVFFKFFEKYAYSLNFRPSSYHSNL